MPLSTILGYQFNIKSDRSTSLNELSAQLSTPLNVSEISHSSAASLKKRATKHQLSAEHKQCSQFWKSPHLATEHTKLRISRNLISALSCYAHATRQPR